MFKLGCVGTFLENNKFTKKKDTLLKVTEQALAVPKILNLIHFPIDY